MKIILFLQGQTVLFKFHEMIYHSSLLSCIRPTSVAEERPRLTGGVGLCEIVITILLLFNRMSCL